MGTQNSVGALSELATAQESVAGTAETTPIKYDYFIGNPALNPMQEVLHIGQAQNRDHTKHALGGYHLEGNFSHFVEPEGMLGWYLKWAFGSVTGVQNGGTGSYKHTFKPARIIYPFTMWFKRAGTQTIKSTYTVVNSISFEQAINDVMRMTANVIGQKDQIATDFGTATYSTLDPFTNAMLTVSIGGSTSGQAAQAHRTSINFSNGISVDDGMVHGSRFYSSIVPGPREVTGSFDVWFDDDSEYERFWGAIDNTAPGTATATVPLIFEWDSGVEAGTGYNYKLTIYIPDVVYKATTVDVGGNRSKQTVEFTAEYDPTSESVMYVELTNTQDEYSAQESMEAAIALDGSSYTDETTEANDASANDMTLLPATPAVGDAYFFGGTFPFPKLRVNVGTQGAGTWTITWYYWNGAWTALSVTNGDGPFTGATGTQNVTYTMPHDWLPTTVNDQEAFYLKAEVTAYTSVTTQPLGTQAWVFE